MSSRFERCQVTLTAREGMKVLLVLVLGTENIAKTYMDVLPNVFG